MPLAGKRRFRMTQSESTSSENTSKAGKSGSKKRIPLVQVQGISKLFPVARGLFSKPAFLRAVDGVSFYVRHGETLALVGESGCGKTTLGRCILRLIEPTYGRIVFEGQDLSPLSQRRLRSFRKEMQIVFQDPYASLNPRMRVRDIVSEGIRIHKNVPFSQISDRVADVLTSVGLSPDFATRFPHEFSAGQRQRIGIARALAVEPSFIVCDEPVSALDVSVRAQITNLLQDLQEQRNIAYLFISHDLSVVRHLSQRVAVMYLGRLVEMGPTSRVFTEPRHPYTKALLSAVPSPDPRRKRLRILLDGEPPSAVCPPSGCAFHPRCPKSDGSLCVERVPVLEIVDQESRQRVACWHPEQ